MTARQLLFSFVAFTVVLIAFNGCKKEESNPSSSETESVDPNIPYNAGVVNINVAILDTDVVAENAYFIPTEDSAALINYDFIEGNLVMAEAYDFFEEGDIINMGPTAAAPYGLLKKVKTKTDYGDLVVYETEEASLNEFFKELHVTESMSLLNNFSKDQKTEESSRKISYSGVIKDLDGLSSTTDDQLTVDGSVTLKNPDVDIDFDISDFTVNKLKFRVYGELGAEAGLKLPGIGDDLSIKGTLKFLDKDLSIYVISLTGIQGRIATLVLVPKLVLETRFEGKLKSPIIPKVSGNLNFDFSTGYSQADGFETAISTSNEVLNVSFASGSKVISEVTTTTKLLAGFRLAAFNRDDNSFMLGTSLNLETNYIANNNPSLTSSLVLESAKELKLKVKYNDVINAEFQKDWNTELYRTPGGKSLGYKYLKRESGHFQFWDGVELEKPLVAKVVNEDDEPVEGIRVLFDSDGGLNGTVLSFATTDENGLASTTWLPNNTNDTIVATLDLNEPPELAAENVRKFYLSQTAQTFPACFFESGPDVDYTLNSAFSVSSNASFQNNLKGEMVGDSLTMSYWYSAGLSTRRVEFKLELQANGNLVGTKSDCKAYNDGSACNSTPTSEPVTLTAYECF